MGQLDSVYGIASGVMTGVSLDSEASKPCGLQEQLFKLLICIGRNAYCIKELGHYGWYMLALKKSMGVEVTCLGDEFRQPIDNSVLHTVRSQCSHGPSMWIEEIPDFCGWTHLWFKYLLLVQRFGSTTVKM